MTEPTTEPTVPTFASFDEFWPYYVGEHLNPVTRWMHFAGTTAAMATLATAGVAAVARKPSLALLAAVLGYGPAWASHFFVEHNRPATFKYPLWSLRGDLVMWKKMIDGSMTAEIDKVMQARRAGDERDATPREPEKRVRVDPSERADEASTGTGHRPLNGVAR